MSYRNGFGNDSHTVLLTHGDETIVNTSIDYFIDVSKGGGHICYLSGFTLPEQDTKTYAFEPKSWTITGYTVGSGGWSHIKCSGNTSDWDFDTGDFTIDFWIYIQDVFGSDGVTGSNGVYLNAISGGNYFGFCWDNGYITSGTGFTFLVKENGVNTIELQSGVTISLQTWYHVAVTRHQDTFRLFFNGRLIDSQTSSLDYKMPNWPSLYGKCYLIGAIADRNDVPLTPVYSMYANYDEFRISKGICRWTSSFTVPEREY